MNFLKNILRSSHKPSFIVLIFTFSLLFNQADEAYLDLHLPWFQLG